MEDDSDVPEEFTNVESRDAVEEAKKLETENKQRIDSALKAKRRKRSEANREAKQKKQKREQKDENHVEEEEEPEMNALAKKNVGFLDASVIQFLVENDRKQNLETTSAPEAPTEKKAPARKLKHKLVDYTVNDRTKLIILKETKPCTGEGVEFLKKSLFDSHKRSLTMLKRSPAPRFRH